MFDTWSYGPQKTPIFEIPGHAPAHRRKDLDLFHQHLLLQLCSSALKYGSNGEQKKYYTELFYKEPESN